MTDAFREKICRNVLSEEAQLLSSNPNLDIIPTKRILPGSSHSNRKNATKDARSTSASGHDEVREYMINHLHTRRMEPSSKKVGVNDNIVTAATASSTSSECPDASNTTTTTNNNNNTTSSGSGGDDDDRGSLRVHEMRVEGGNAIGNVCSNWTSNGTKARSMRTRHENEAIELQSKNIDGFPPKKKTRHYQHDSHNQRSWSQSVSLNSHSLNDDGSTLKVPGDDGSDRIVPGDIRGGVPIKPATVVASRLFTPKTSGTEPLAAGTGQKRRWPSETSTQNQNHLLLQPHREPRYHTIRNTLYRFQGSDGNRNDKINSNRSKKTTK
jgi:hypothetical protein